MENKPPIPNKLFILLFKQLYNYKLTYFFGVVFLFATAHFQSLLPFMAKELGEIVIQGIPSKTSITSYLLIAMAIVFFRTGSRLLFFTPARLLEKNLRLDFVDLLQQTYPERYNDVNPGQLYQSLQVDIQIIRALIGFAFLQFTNFIMTLIILLPKLFSFHEKLLWGLTPLLLSIFLLTYILSKYHRYYIEIQNLQGEVQNFLIESFSGKKTIKNYGRENQFRDLFSKRCQDELDIFNLTNKGRALAFPLIPLGVAGSLIWGISIINSLELGIPSIILYSGFVYLLREPLAFISWIGVVYGRSQAAHKRLIALQGKLLTPDLEEKRTQDLKNIPYFDTSLCIYPQTWTGIIGETASGKSTLLNKIAFILKNQGKKINLVFQDPYLYNDNISNNLFYGQNPSPEQKKLALNYLKIFDLIELAPQNEIFNLEVGENGKKLSGGQVKRICLLRSLLNDAEYLLWDDPFSSVDLITERNIMRNLKKDFPNKKFLLTTHRFSTAKNLESLYFIDKNKGIVEQGSTKELLNDKLGLSYDFFKKQMV